MTGIRRTERGRLLVLTSTYPRWKGDSEPAFVHELCQRLAGRFDVMVLAPHAPGARREEIVDRVRVKRYRYAPMPWQRLAYEGGILANLRRNPALFLLLPAFMLGLGLALMRELRASKPQVVHAHWLVPQGLVATLVSALTRHPTRLVCISHGSDTLALRGRIWAGIRRWIIRRSSRTIAVSDAVAGQLQDEQPAAAPLLIIPTGVDLKGRFTPGNDLREDGHLLFVGRLVSGKGIPTLLDAFARLAPRYPLAHLTVVGSGPEEQDLRAHVDRLGLTDRVHFIGPLPQQELPKLYRRATLLVLPSMSEGLGLVLVEALGCACPVVASDLPAIREVLRHGKGGSLFPVGNVVSLVDRIEELLTDPAKRATLAQAGRQHALERYDWTMIADRHADLIERLCDITPEHDLADACCNPQAVPGSDRNSKARRSEDAD